MLLLKQYLQRVGIPVINIHFNILKRHSDFPQAGNGKEYVALTFTIIAVALFIGLGWLEKANVIVME